MPHHKKRGKPSDLVLGENEVSQEFAEELAQKDERNIEYKKTKKAKRK